MKVKPDLPSQVVMAVCFGKEKDMNVKFPDINSEVVYRLQKKKKKKVGKGPGVLRNILAAVDSEAVGLLHNYRRFNISMKSCY